MRSQYALLCEHFREGKGGVVDVLGVFDRVLAEAFPCQHRAITFVCMVFAESEDDLGPRPYRIVLLDPRGNPVGEIQGQLDLRPDGPSAWLASGRLVMTFQGVVFFTPGAYSVRLEIAGKPVAEHRLSVTLNSPAKS